MKKYLNTMKKYLALLLLVPAVAFGTAYICYISASTYYVSPSGSDTNAPVCGFSAPCLTINSVISRMNPGDNLYLRGGTYNQMVSVPINISGTALNPITISAFSFEVPIIDGTGVSMGSGNYVAAFDVEGSYINVTGITIQNWNLTNPGGTSTYHSGRGLAVNNNSGAHLVSNVNINNVTVHDVFGGGIIVFSDYSTVTNSTVYRSNLNNCRFANLAMCEPTVSSGSSGCVAASGVPSTGGGCNSGNAVWDGGITAAGQDGHSNWVSTNLTVSNSVSYDNWGEGVLTYTGNNVHFIGNTSYNNFSENMYASNSTGLLENGNLIYNTPTATTSTYASNDAYWGGDTPPYEAWPGFSIDDECTDFPSFNCSIPAYNLSENETVTNNFMYNTPVCIFCFTLVTNPNASSPGTGAGAALSGLQNSLVANNTIVATADIPNLQLQLSTFKYLQEWATGYQGLTPKVWNCNSWIKNNIIIAPSPGSYNYATYGSLLIANASTNTNASCPGQVTLTYDYQYWTLSGAYVPSFAQGTHDIQQPSGSPIRGGACCVATNFILKAGSTAFNAGIAIPSASSPSGTGVIADYFGNAMQSPPNIGGYQ